MVEGLGADTQQGSGKVTQVHSKKDIFFIRSDRLGEFLLSLPAIKLVKENHPDSNIYLLARKENIDLIRNVDFVDYFIEYKEDYFRGLRGAFHLAKIFRRENIGCVIVLNPKKEFHFASLLARIRCRVGYDRKWGFCLNRTIEDKKFLADKHEVEYNLDLVSLICRNVFVPRIDIPTPQIKELTFLKNHLNMDKKCIALHPFSSHSLKKIPSGFWLELTQRIKSVLTQTQLVIIGAEEDRQEGLALQKLLEIRNITGRLSLSNLATFLRSCTSLLIGLDSGPMHLASMLKVPVVGLFSASNMRRWGPYDTDSLVIQAESERGFVDKIDEIISFIRRFLPPPNHTS